MRPTSLIQCLSTFAMAVISLLLATPAEGTRLLVCSHNTNSVLRYDARSGASLGAFVPSGSGGLDGPHGLVFGPDGHLYVCNRYQHSIARYSGSTGAFIDTFVPPHSGGLDVPIPLLFGTDGSLLVGSLFTDNILRYDGETGAFSGEFVPVGSGGLDGPSNLLYGPDGNLYVNSEFTHSVLRYSGTSGAYIDTFVTSGSGGLDRATGSVFGPDGHLYVSSYITSTILRYDGRTGAVLGTFVSAGSGGLDGPTKLRFGPDDNLYVVSQNNNRILRYNGRTGSFIDTFVAPGGGGLNGPTALAFSPPDAPSGLTVTTASTSDVRLSWADNSDDEAGFEIERKTGTGSFSSLAFVGANVTGFVDSSIALGNLYTYRVRAISSFGRSVASDGVEVGVSTGGRLRVDRLLLLPSTRLGGTSSLTLFVDNVGTGVLAGNVGTLAMPFTVLSGAGRFVLGPRQSQAVVISFTPRTEGGFADNLLIQSTDITQPTVSVPVVGEGAAPLR